MSNLTVKDLEILQGTLNKVGLDYQLELDEGKILVMGPSFQLSVISYQLSAISYQLTVNS